MASALLLAACGSSPVSSAHPGSPSPSALASTPAPTATPAGQTTSGGGSSSGGGGGRTPTPTARPSASPTTGNGLPVITSFDIVPTCTTTSGTATAKLTWTSQNATEAWITNPPVAVAAGDPKTTSGAKGPLPANGSTTMPFDCSQQYNYYDLGVYAGTAQPNRLVKQVQRNV